MAPKPVRVMLVDDHALVRAAIRQAITGPDLELVAEATTGEEALALAPKVRPDVLLLDIDLPGVSGLHVVRELALRLPATRIVMLSVSESERDVLEAMRLGAVGYLTKDHTPDALARAILSAHRGELAMSRQMAASLVRRLIAGAGSPGSTPKAGLESLSARELEVLRLLAEGLTDREIGQSLSLSSRTIETHVGSILRKLAVRNRAEAAGRYRALR